MFFFVNLLFLQVVERSLPQRSFFNFERTHMKKIAALAIASMIAGATLAGTTPATPAAPATPTTQGVATKPAATEVAKPAEEKTKKHKAAHKAHKKDEPAAKTNVPATK